MKLSNNYDLNNNINNLSSNTTNITDTVDIIDTTNTINSKWLLNLTNFKFDYTQYIPKRDTNIKILVGSTGVIFFYTSYKYNLLNCNVFITNIKTNIKTNSMLCYNKVLSKIYTQTPICISELPQQQEIISIPNTGPIKCKNGSKLYIPESNPNPVRFQTKTYPDKLKTPPQKSIYSSPIMIYPLIIGCNYSNTPYELQNCVDNTNLVKDLLSDFKSDKIKCSNPIIKTDLQNNITNILDNITLLYNLCNDNDVVFIYYSGYCDKKCNQLDDITNSLEDPIIDDGDKFEVPMKISTSGTVST